LKPVPEKDIIVSDVRDLDPAEGEMLRDSDITIVESMKALQAVPLPDKPIYLHFDTDVVNTDEMPAMSYPADGGPSLSDTVAAVRRIVREGEIAGVLFTLWNNGLPGADKAQHSTMQVLRAVLEELHR
ncbi:MAG: arginase family protein, partial [Aggregatilineales bacterium]